jgi:type II secretory pathway pseudopilin PulG
MIATRRQPSTGRTRRARRRRAAGFGLMEIMVTAALASLVLLGFAANSIGVARTSAFSRNAAAATALAQQQVERLRRLPLDAPGLTPGSYIDAGNPMRADASPNGIFERNWIISARDIPAMGLKTITVTVDWTDHSAHQARLQAYVRCSTVPCS